MTTSTLEPIDELFAALAEPTRRHLLDRIAVHGTATATVLAGESPVSRQAVVQHLAILEKVALVSSMKAGRERQYVVRPEPLTEAARWMDRIAAQWDARLAVIKKLAEAAD
jgi:DNA-binding transcriptional ArsR family regulator